ncbi:MAG: 4-(cytidine 5'-diphospho)-2-C-methyl-D-erythritol kinase, partial [Rhodothermales bacterium]|nr:4-(cytidine 5'-diphospho)-2-C-methyl-D-erythritol kinase [Rhodothermales bacterium]
MLRRRAPGKINLGLHVLRRRGDGFHDIETVFLRIPWYDVVTVQPASGISMTCSDRDLPVDDRNTCVLAARLLAQSVGTDMGVHIHLDKRVPYG